MIAKTIDLTRFSNHHLRTSDAKQIQKISTKKSFYYLDLLPAKLYLVVFYQVSLVNQTRITCLDFRRPSVLLLVNFVVPYHMFIPPWESCNKCSNMIVSVKYSVSWTLFVNLINPQCFFPLVIIGC